jgi:hypothetical protein
MTNKVEITMTPRGFDVTTGTHTSHFPSIADAVDFAQRRLQQAQDLRELSARCE